MIPAISSRHHSGGTTALTAIAHTVIAHAGDCDHLILLRTAFTMKIMRRIPPKKIPTLIKSANNFITASTANTAIKMMTANIKFPFRFIFSSLPAVVSPTATLRLRRCMRYPCPMSHALYRYYRRDSEFFAPSFKISASGLQRGGSMDSPKPRRPETQIDFDQKTSRDTDIRPHAASGQRMKDNPDVRR